MSLPRSLWLLTWVRMGLLWNSPGSVRLTRDMDSPNKRETQSYFLQLGRLRPLEQGSQRADSIRCLVCEVPSGPISSEPHHRHDLVYKACCDINIDGLREIARATSGAVASKQQKNSGREGLQVEHPIREETGWEDGTHRYIASHQVLASIQAGDEVKSKLLALVVLERKLEMSSHREILMPVLQERIDRELGPVDFLPFLRREAS